MVRSHRAWGVMVLTCFVSKMTDMQGNQNVLDFPLDIQPHLKVYTRKRTALSTYRERAIMTDTQPELRFRIFGMDCGG